MPKEAINEKSRGECVYCGKPVVSNDKAVVMNLENPELEKIGFGKATMKYEADYAHMKCWKDKGVNR